MIKKLLFLLFFSYITIHAQKASVPSLQRLMSYNMVEITIKCFANQEHPNVEAWQEMAIAINALLELCYASESDPENSILMQDQLFQDLHRIIEQLRHFNQIKDHIPVYSVFRVTTDKMHGNILDKD